MLNDTNLAGHIRKLRENRTIAMTCARVARALRDGELVAQYIREARIATLLIVNARQHGVR